MERLVSFRIVWLLKHYLDMWRYSSILSKNNLTHVKTRYFLNKNLEVLQEELSYVTNELICDRLNKAESAIF